MNDGSHYNITTYMRMTFTTICAMPIAKYYVVIVTALVYWWNPLHDLFTFQHNYARVTVTTLLDYHSFTIHILTMLHSRLRACMATLPYKNQAAVS